MPKIKHKKMFPPGCFNPFVDMLWYIDDVPNTGEKKRKRIDHVNTDTQNAEIESQKACRKSAQNHTT